MAELSHYIMFNSKSGTALSGCEGVEALQSAFAEQGHTVEIDADDSVPFAQRLDRARNSTAPVLVAAGGDGTVTAMASVAAETGKTLAVIPLGTANLLARDLAIPLKVEEWFAKLAEMEPRRVDVGEVNGRLFLHKVVIGAVPGIAAAREQVRGQHTLAATFGFFRHMFRRLQRLRRFSVEITGESGVPRFERVQSIAVVNNDYDEGPGQVFSRSRLDGGRLSLYLLRHLSVGDALRLGFSMLVGSWKGDEVLEEEDVHQLVLRTRWRRVWAVVDGEVEFLKSPVKFQIKPLALTVLAPPVEPETETVKVEPPLAAAEA